jgi:hypothetical protein
MASHEASTTPTALIARLQLLACTSAHEYQGTGIVILSELPSSIELRGGTYKVFNLHKFFKDAQSCQ